MTISRARCGAMHRRSKRKGGAVGGKAETHTYDI